MANVSGWTSSQPSGESSIRLGDDLIRSDKSILSAALNSEHYFDPVTSASSNSGGLHRPGSARLWSAQRASLTTPSSNDSSGQMWYATDMLAFGVFTASSIETFSHGSNPPGARLYSATTTASSGATLPIMMATENYDIGGYTSANTNVFTVPAGLGGRYLLTLNASFPSLHTGTRRAIAITRGAETIAVASVGTGNMTQNISLSCSALDACVPTQTYSAFCWQDSGGNLSVDSVYFAIQKI